MYFMEEEKFKTRIDQLESEVTRLKELVMTLVGSVQYRNDKPYWAYLAQSMTYGEKETELSLMLIGICRRLEGEEQPIKPKRLCENNSYMQEAYSNEPMTEKEAIELLAQVVGPVDAPEVLHGFIKQSQN
nr:competence protein ComFB [Mobiluncus mulieris]